MELKNSTILITAFLILPFFVQAQSHDKSKDTVGKTVSRFVAAEFAERRLFNVDYKQFGNYNFTPRLKNQNELQEGKITNWSVLTVSANVNLVQKRRWQLQVGGLYRYTSVNEDITSKQVGVMQNYFQGDHHFHSEGLTFNYFSKLFGKTAIYSASVFMDGSEQSIERVRGMATGVVVLKADQKTRMSVGLMATSDPNTMLPLLPIFLYENKFSNYMMIDMLLPRYAFIRTRMYNYGRLSAGWELDQQTFFLHDFNESNKTYQFSQVDANVGLVYEHLLPARFMLTVRAGYRVTPFARVFEKDQSLTEYTWAIKTDPAPYANVGLSFNPFAKRK